MIRPRRPAVVFPIPADASPATLKQSRRRLLADWCILVGQRLRDPEAVDLIKPHDPLEGLTLPPRARQVLTCLLVGDSEKQVAMKLRISPHTVHDNVKKLHHAFGVCSRSELLAKFIRAK